MATKQARISYAELVELQKLEKDLGYWRELSKRCLAFALAKGATAEDLVELMTSPRGVEVVKDD
jgi:hypothetical protein